MGVRARVVPFVGSSADPFHLIVGMLSFEEEDARMQIDLMTGTEAPPPMPTDPDKEEDDNESAVCTRSVGH